MKEIREMDQKGIDFLVNEEGVVLKPYLDKAGVPTIGIGMTYYPDTGKKVSMKDKAITKEQAISYFKQMLKTYELAVYSNTRDDITQGNFNALVSLTYNIGVQGFKDSTVRRLVNSDPKDPAIEGAFNMWRKSGGKIDPVLVGRRKREWKIYSAK